MSKDKRTNEITDGELPADLKAFEARLAALKPRPDRLDRDALLFEAGQASAQVGLPYRWAWPSAFGAMTTLAVVLLTVVLLRPEPQPVVQYVYVEHAAEPVTIPDDPMPQLAEDTLPEVQTPSATPVRPDESLMASAARNWFGVSLSGSSPRQRQLESLLAQGADADLFPNDSSKGNGGARSATGPQSLRQWRDRLLEGTTSDRPTAVPTLETLFKNGANS